MSDKVRNRVDIVTKEEGSSKVIVRGRVDTRVEEVESARQGKGTK